MRNREIEGEERIRQRSREKESDPLSQIVFYIYKIVFFSLAYRLRKNFYTARFTKKGKIPSFLFATRRDILRIDPFYLSPKKSTYDRSTETINLKWPNHPDILYHPRNASLAHPLLHCLKNLHIPLEHTVTRHTLKLT